MTAETRSGVICAAGGIVARPTPQGPTIAVIHRLRYGDWCLPKGKLQGGESWQDAAVREVREEIGCPVRITTFAGSSTYEVGRTPKIVLFWNMVVDGDCEFQPSEEVDQVVWLSPQQALKRVQYPGDKALISAVYPQRRRPLLVRLRISRPSPEHRRLAGNLQAYSVELDRLTSLSKPGAQMDSTWATAARALIDNAEADLEEGRVDESWKCFDAARRMEHFGLEDEALIARAQALREEAGKLNPWRKKAVETVLSDLDKAGTEAKRGRVYHAAWLRDEHLHNTYFKIHLLRHQLKILLWILGLALVSAVLVLSTSGALDSKPTGDNWRTLLAIGLFGVLGASFSAILSLVGTSTQSRIPEQVVNSTVTAMRPLLGAAAALAIYVFLKSGFISLEVTTWAGILAIAFASGFSERLVIRAVEAVAGKGS